MQASAAVHHLHRSGGQNLPQEGLQDRQVGPEEAEEGPAEAGQELVAGRPGHAHRVLQVSLGVRAEGLQLCSGPHYTNQIT